MARKAHAKGGNGDIIFDYEKGTAKKYLRNTSAPEKITRFKRELSFLSSICKNPIPNIVEVIGVNINEQNISESYIEMKKYDGSLYDILSQTKGNVRLSLELILPIIKALHKLSENDTPLYHRDIKPDNILFSENNGVYTLYLTDFGICFLNDGNERLTPETMAVGPRMYIAPEYEIGRVEDVTEKGDIFSIGKVIWCMINGEADDFMPSNFWFVDEYDLIKRFPSNPDMLMANVIISSCLNTNPNERCDYPTLIKQIENLINCEKMTAEKETQYKVKAYQEKRKLELLEIKKKNRMIVNCFSIYYLEALKRLIELYPGFELIKKLYDEYSKKSKDGKDYTSINVENNSAHYLYSGTYDRIYFSINYEPAKAPQKYCNIKISYQIDNWKSICFYYSENGAIVYKNKERELLLTEDAMVNIMNSIVMEYVE